MVDLNGDGSFDLGDINPLQELLAEDGVSLGTNGVPEPYSLVLLAVTVGLALTNRSLLTSLRIC